jgi:hypothetical protein
MNVLQLLSDANPVPLASVLDLSRELPTAPRLGASQTARRRRLPMSRLIVVLVVGVVVVATPALAVRTEVFTSIRDFLAGNAPVQAHAAIATFVRTTMGAGSHGSPTEVALALTAHGPDGDVQLYDVRFDDGGRGLAMVDVTNDPPRVGGASWGSQSTMVPQHGIVVRGSFVATPGQSAIYFDGIVSSKVASAELDFADGRVEPLNLGGGLLLGWVQPQDGAYSDAMLVGRDAHGAAVSRTDVCSIGNDVQFRDHPVSAPDDLFAACALPPTPDH